MIWAPTTLLLSNTINARSSHRRLRRAACAVCEHLLREAKKVLVEHMRSSDRLLLPLFDDPVPIVNFLSSHVKGHSSCDSYDRRKGAIFLFFCGRFLVLASAFCSHLASIRFAYIRPNATGVLSVILSIHSEKKKKGLIDKPLAGNLLK